MEKVNDPGVGTWDPPENSVGLFRVFTSLDETRSTSWTVNEKGELVAELDDRHEWPDWRQVAEWIKAREAYKKDSSKPWPRYEDYVKTSDR